MKRRTKSDDGKPITVAQARQKLQEGAKDYLAGNDPGTIVFRLERTKNANATYPLKITQLQRETILRCTRLGKSLKNKIEQAGDGTQVVDVTWKDLHKLIGETGNAAMFESGVDKKRLMAVQGKVMKFIEEEDSDVFSGFPPKSNQRQPIKSDLLYQFKITLMDIKPVIWRRIQIPDCTLGNLHEYIQAAFGWTNSHLHQFTIDGVWYSQPAPSGYVFEMEFEDETRRILSKLLPNSANRAQWLYEYDFGDGWRHEILFEGCPPMDPKVNYPLCIEGERACPPEDCGGPWAFAQYLKALANPTHKENKENLEWRGWFDPEEFSAKESTRAMLKAQS